MAFRKSVSKKVLKMKELENSDFVGKLVECKIHLRTFEIEKGDHIIGVERSGRAMRGNFTYYTYSVKLPCGCTINIYK